MIIGHNKQRQLLKKAFQGVNIPQALIFSGMDYLGKKKIALDVIKSMNCVEDEPCNTCSACELIEKQNHPDLIVVSPDDKEIKIDTIRDLQMELSRRPQFFSRKTVIIDNAHTLNLNAQHCLLKTLEEPPGGTIFFLVTSLPDALLPTIRSRCEVLKFYPVSEKELIEKFEDKQSLPEFNNVLTICGGRPGFVVKCFEDHQFLIEKQTQLKTIEKLLKGSLVEKFAFAKNFFNKETTQQQSLVFLGNLIEQLRSLLFSKLEIKKDEQFEKILENYSTQQLKQALLVASDLNFLFQHTNINKRVGFENLMLNL